MGRTNRACLLYLFIQLNSSRTQTHTHAREHTQTKPNKPTQLKEFEATAHRNGTRNNEEIKCLVVFNRIPESRRNEKHTRYMTFYATSVDDGVICYDAMMWIARTESEPRHPVNVYLCITFYARHVHRTHHIPVICHNW